MDIRLTGKKSICEEIKDTYEYYIRLGAFREGERLPSVRKLAVKLGVNPNTVERAYTALERSGLEIGRTEGFNPHPKMVFSMPLSMYQESLCEFLDISVGGDVSYDGITERLAAVFPPGFEVLRAAAPVKAAKSIKYAAYRIIMDTDMSAAEARKILSGPMPVEKRGKGGTKIADIAPMIKSASVTAGAGTLVIDAVVNASGESYLNPAYIVSFLAPGCAFSRVTRLSFLDADGRAFA